MKTWFISLNGAITLSMIALFSLLARSYADTRYILVEDFGSLGMGIVVLWIIGYTAIIGGWIWSLVAAAKGSRRALVILLVYALLTALWFGAGSLVQYASVPAEYIIFSLSLITGVLATLSVSLQLRETRHSSRLVKP